MVLARPVARARGRGGRPLPGRSLARRPGVGARVAGRRGVGEIAAPAVARGARRGDWLAEKTATGVARRALPAPPAAGDVLTLAFDTAVGTPFMMSRWHHGETGYPTVNALAAGPDAGAVCEVYDCHRARHLYGHVLRGARAGA